jgi:hypothetical protein
MAKDMPLDWLQYRRNFRGFAARASYIALQMEKNTTK